MAQESEILRNIPNNSEFNAEVVERLRDNIEGEIDYERPTVHLKARYYI